MTTYRPPRGRPAGGQGLAALLLALAAAAAPAALAAQQAPLPRAVPPGAARALSLAEALALAERQSEAVRIAQAGVLRAEGQQTQARSGYLPQLSLALSYQRTIQSQFQEIAKAAAEGAPPDTSGQENPFANNPLTQIFASKNTVVLNLQGSQTVFSGGRLRAQNHAAAAGRRAAEVGLVSQRAQVKLDVAQAYYDAVLADRLVAIAESSFVSSERTVRQTQLARNVGTVSEFELLRARVTRDNQRPAVIQARTLRQTAYLYLRQLLDLPLDEPLALSDRLPDAEPAAAIVAAAQAQASARPVSLTVDADAVLADDRTVVAAVDSVVARADTSAEGRAPVRQARENVEAQRNALRAVRGQRLPAVGLATSYQRFAYPRELFPGLDETYPNFTVSLGVSVPILTGGRIRGEEQVARANLQQAESQLQQAKEFAALDASVAIAELTRAEAAYAASAGTAQVASRAHAIADVRFREGLSTQVELSDSRVQLAQAQAYRAQAARNLQVARLRLALIRDLPLQAGGAGAAGGAAAPGADPGAQGAPGGGMQQQPQSQGGAQGGAAGGPTQQSGSAGGRN